LGTRSRPTAPRGVRLRSAEIGALRALEHEIRERLAYAPPYGDQRRRLEYRFREAHYERERCEDR
jgi:hypothetical protein